MFEKVEIDAQPFVSPNDTGAVEVLPIGFPPDAQLAPAPNATTDVSPAAKTQLGTLTSCSLVFSFARILREYAP